MKSIRLSLVVYFLALLATAVTVIGVLVHRTMERTLQEKNYRTRLLLEAVRDNRIRDAHEALERSLFRRATTLARLAKSQTGGSILQEDRDPLMLLPGLLGQPAYPAVQLLPTPSPRPPFTEFHNPLGQRLRPMTFIRIQDADVIMTAPDLNEAPGARHPREYFQVYNEEGIPTQHSEALATGSFTLDQRRHDAMEALTHEYDTVEIHPGVTVHRITLRAPVPAYRYVWGMPPPSRGGPGRRDARGGPQQNANQARNPQGIKLPTFFVQCAAETDVRDELIQQYKAEFQRDLEQLGAETQIALISLRNWLLYVGLFTFAATLLGGFWLVRLGLSPLQRLTTAVSQVSERDFHLPVGDQPMPRELTPIVKRLRETLDELRRAFEREKQAAADISHELRTPLAALLATTDVALRKDRTPEEYKAALTDCRASGRQMSQLVERLLALARLDAGVVPVQAKDVEVTEVAEVCSAIMRPLAESRGLHLTYHEAPPVTASTDPDKLNEAINNLLHNAIEYNRAAGSIDVRVARRNGSVVVEVADTGIGIAPQNRERIFERFFRADPSRQADGLHAGLGLAITKSYIELMGGRLSVESCEGQGSTFTIELPLAKNGASHS